MTLNRRDFLKCGACAALPLAMPRLAFGSTNATRDVLVVVFQRGGADGLNSIVPHGDADYYRLRPTLAVARPGTGTGAALDLDGFFGLNPALAPLLPLYQAGRLAAVQATGFLLGSRSHFDCQDFMERAALNSAGVSSGWLNRHLEAVGVTETFEAVGVGKTLQLALRGNAPTIGIDTFANFTVRTTSARKAEITDALGDLFASDSLLDATARRSLAAVDELAVANPAQYLPANGAVYPSTSFGNQMKSIAQLVKADIGLAVATVDTGGWDLHDDEADQLAPLLDDLAKSLAAFDTDLGAAMANVTVVTMTEFGRRVQQNASGGTDHGSGYAMLLLGGGVTGRNVFRTWPGLRDDQLFRGDLAITTDYRAVLSEVLVKRGGGTDLARVFPGYAQQPFVNAFVAR
ncbi:MAG TPA: DUF1501 domain-containing protein [Xanthomonadales bacterium]|nr:DUF1501 domain-containing protein [Xanthomonadales bacterium]